MAFAAFDVLEMDGERVMGEPWTARRKRLDATGQHRMRSAGTRRPRIIAQCSKCKAEHRITLSA